MLVSRGQTDPPSILYNDVIGRGRQTVPPRRHHGCFNHARFGILVSAHARYHDVALPLGLFVEELYLCVEVILRNRTWSTIAVKVRKAVVLRTDSKSIMNC